MTIKKKKKLYEGKAKILYSTGDSYSLIQHFKDEATAFNAKKKEVIEGILLMFQPTLLVD